MPKMGRMMLPSPQTRKHARQGDVRKASNRLKNSYMAPPRQRMANPTAQRPIRSPASTSPRSTAGAPARTTARSAPTERLWEDESWLFEGDDKHAAEGSTARGAGTTGLPNAGAATDPGKQMRHWREVAGLSDNDTKKEGKVMSFRSS